MNDLKYALRQLRKNPGFTTVAALTLALGIGANTAIFSLIDQVMLRRLPVRNPQELIVVPGQFSYPRYEKIRDDNEVFSGIFGAHVLSDMTVSVPGQPASPAIGELVSGSYFATLGVGAILGRTLLPADDGVPESSPVAVISYGLWKRAFGGAPDVLGQKIQVRSGSGNAGTSGLDIYDGATARPPEGAVLTIVGVAPPEFFGEAVGTATDVWIPMMMEPAVMPGRPWLAKGNVRWVAIMGRRRPGVTPEQAGAAMTVRWRQILIEEAGAKLTEDRKRSIAQEVLKVESGEKGFSQIRRQFSQPLQILMAAVGMVLLIACLNVANLLLARANTRQREFGVRLALGARRERLIRQLLTESLVLGVLGGTLGLLIAFFGTKTVLALVSSGPPPIAVAFKMDLRTLSFTITISLVTVILFGLAPAFRATRISVADTLKEAARSTTGGRRGGAARILVAGQVASSLVLLIGAGLFLRTLYNLKTQDVGYNPNHLVLMRVDPISAGYRGDDIGRVCKNLLDRIAILPGVRAATFSENGLFDGPESGMLVDVEGFTATSDQDKQARFDQVGPNYFTKVGIPLLLGRDLTERDSAGAPRVAVINETMAKFYFPDGNPLGKKIGTRVGNQRIPLEIVGVARDAQDHNLRWEPVRRFYVSYFQPIDGITTVNFEIRTAGNPGGLAAMLRAEVQAVDRNLMLLGIRNLKSLMDQTLVQEHFIATLSALFGLLAVTLAAIGLYGVVAYEVTQRTSEIGLRMALGARRSDVLKLVLKNGMRLTLLGMMIGLGGAAALTQLVRSQLHGVNAIDPLTFLIVACGLFFVTGFACWLPARRATKVDPMEALRYE